MLSGARTSTGRPTCLPSLTMAAAVSDPVLECSRSRTVKSNPAAEYICISPGQLHS